MAVRYPTTRPVAPSHATQICSGSCSVKYRVQYSYTGIPLTKLLNQRGLLSIDGALKVQSFFYSLGVKVKETLVLVAQK